MAGIDIWAVSLLVTVGFVATNLDNLLLLVGFAAVSADRRGVMLGYLAAATTVLAACVAGGFIGGLLRPELVGYLGVVPLVMGLALGWRVLRGGAPAEAPRVGGVFFLTLSNSGDSVALFMPLLSESDEGSLLLMIVIYLLLMLAWAGAALVLVRHRPLARALAAAGHWLLPVIMIAVGIYILLDTGTDTLR